MVERSFVTGAAGFIGSNLVDRLLESNQVTGYDNFSTGRKSFLDQALKNANFKLVEGDILDLIALTDAMKGSDCVYHLAANADIRFGTFNPNRDFEQNTVATFNVLRAMKANGIKKIIFASTGSIYGETRVIPTPEDAPYPVQTSSYGASKAAGEAMIQAWCHGFNVQAWIFRFVGVLGERYTHGHIVDFYKNLKENPKHLRALGNGHQKKSYVYVQDAIDAILTAVEKAKEGINIFNIGTDEFCELHESITWICETLGLSPQIEYAGGERGWIGDIPFIYLDTKRIRGLGWQPKVSIRQAVEKTVAYLQTCDALAASGKA